MRNSVFELIESVRDFKVLFVGDVIVDEYHYVTSLGKSPKEHLIPVAFKSKEQFLGGVEAAANHVRSFCGTVDILPWVGGVRKVRFVDPLYTRKLFEVHYVTNGWNAPPVSDGYDIVIVTDFGHGSVVTIPPGFRAVNAQTNSANIGYNLITKYKHADYIVIDEPKPPLPAPNRHSPLQHVIFKL